MPVAERCSSCHVDVHAGQFVATAGGPGCDNCHEAAGWVPTTYGLERHQGWRLTGAHQAVPCADCHKPGPDSLKLPVFRLEVATCAGCHAQLDPHGGQFAGRACSECHTTDTFTLPGFDHSRTRYPLDGAHRTVPCASCHRPVPDASGRLVAPYRGVGMACRDCHGAPS